MKDFFNRSRKTKTHSYIAPAIFALVLSVSIVSTIHTGGDLRMISASVIQGVNPVHYDADLLIERTSGTIGIRIGKNAEKVDTIRFSLVGDPSLFLGLTSSDEKVHISSENPGFYTIMVDLKKMNLLAGDVIASLQTQVADKASLAGTDAVLTSEGVEYDLSVKN